MPKPSLALASFALASLALTLLSSQGHAQLVLSDSGLVAPSPLATYDLGAESGAILPGWPSPAGPTAVAADEAGQVLYLVDGSGSLFRWPYSDPAPTLVPAVGSFLTVEDMTFAHGRLYLLIRNLCRSQVFEVNLATSAVTLWFDATSGSGAWMYAIGLAYDPASDSILALFHQNGSSSGGGCATAPTGPVGVHVLDPITQTSSLLTTFASPGAYGAATVGNGRLWVHNRFSTEFENLDLATLIWDPTPPANTMTYGLAGWQGVAWAPGIAGGPSGPVIRNIRRAIGTPRPGPIVTVP